MKKKIKLQLWSAFVGFSVFMAFFALTNIVLLVSIPNTKLTNAELYGNQVQINKNDLGTLICDKPEPSVCVQLDPNGEFIHFIYKEKVIHGGEKF